MTRPIASAPFWPSAPRPLPSSDPAALAALARLVDAAGPPAGPGTIAPSFGGPDDGDAPIALVRAGGRVVGFVLPFPADGEGPVFTPVRGPGRIRELVEEGIIG
jgi:hypothetical protein